MLWVLERAKVIFEMLVPSVRNTILTVSFVSARA